MINPLINKSWFSTILGFSYGNCILCDHYKLIEHPSNICSQCYVSGIIDKRKIDIDPILDELYETASNNHRDKIYQN